MFDFSFLNNVEVVTPEKETRVNVAKTDKYPTEGTVIRVWANGNVFPSPALVVSLALEYATKGDTTAKENGLDVFAFSKMPNAPQIAQDCIMISAVAKTAPKVDLFGSCKYDEVGQPKSSVLTQGGGTFGEEFVAMIKEVYGIEIPKGAFLDLEVKLDISPKVSPIVYLPKIVDRGPKKGQPDVARRENITIYPLVPIVSTQAPIEVSEVVEEQLVMQREEEKRDETITEIIPEIAIVPEIMVNGEVVETTPTPAPTEFIAPAPIVENTPIIYPTL